MEKKRILLITKSFYPVSGPRSTRATELVKSLASEGHAVKVLTPYNSQAHPDFAKGYNVEIENLGTHFFNEPRKSKVSTLGVKAVLKMLDILKLANRHNLPDVFFKELTYQKIKNETNWDLLISIAKPHSIHWGVAKALQKNKSITKKWIADCGDPFMGNPFYTPANKFIKEEKLFCELADVISVPIPEAINSYYEEYQHKVKVIPQGFNFKIDNQKTGVYKKNNIPTFCYSGVFYKNKRDPRKLLEYLISLKEPFKFIIYTSSAKLIRTYIDKSDGRIEVRNYIPRHDLLKKLSEMDFLININNISNVQSPSKLVDYYLSSRPVLSLANNEVPKEFIKQFFKGDYTNRYPFQNMERYNIEEVTEQFLNA
ncbi:hypothetical protein ACXGQW_04015 [Wenyingzhuangia sp. IMCC45533]